MGNLGAVVASVRAGDGAFGAVPITGGLNNAVYDVSLANGDRVVCKLYRVDDRQRDEREWRALRLLQDAGCDFAPLPLHHEPGAVVMSHVEGIPLGFASLDEEQQGALVAVLERLYRVTVTDSLPPVVGHPAHMVGRVRGLHAQADRGDTAVAEAGRWLDSDEPNVLSSLPLPLTVLGRGDPNLANCLWNEPRMAFVDWEYSGRTNRAFELADLVEHLQSRGTPDTVWDAIIDAFAFAGEEQRAFNAARRLIAIFFLLMLQPGQLGAELNPPDRLRAQADRVLALLD